MGFIKYALSAMVLIMSASFASAEIAIVVSKSSGFSQVSADDVVKIFLGKKKDIGGSPVLPVDQVEGSAARNAFYSNLVKKSESQLKSYWSRLIFTGKGQAPQVVGGDSDVVSMIATNPSLIGYVDAGAVTGDVMVIFKQ